mgnify:CR=1 FL=1
MLWAEHVTTNTARDRDDVLDGVRPPLGARDHSMPEFGASLTDENIADVLRFVRVQYTNLPAWEHLEEIIAEKRENW